MSADNFISLTYTDGDATFVKNIIKLYILRMGICISVDPMVCGPCHKCPQSYDTLISNCLEVNRKMNQLFIVSGENDQQVVERAPGIVDAANTLIKQEQCSNLIKLDPEDVGENFQVEGGDWIATGSHAEYAL